MLFQGISGEDGYRGYPGDEGGPVSTAALLIPETPAQCTVDGGGPGPQLSFWEKTGQQLPYQLSLGGDALGHRTIWGCWCGTEGYVSWSCVVAGG